MTQENNNENLLPLISIDEFPNLSKNIIAQHFFIHFFSLKEYPEKYLHLFFKKTEIFPVHFAYVCPICLRNGILMEESIKIASHCEFSYDHFPPKSVGGFLKLLVCKKCNNDAGGKYENELITALCLKSFEERTIHSKLLGTSEIENVPGHYNTIFSIDEEGKLKLDLKPKQNSHTPFLDRFLEESEKDNNWKINLHISTPNKKKILKAFLKAAYLFCFEFWGYDFVYSTTGEEIRKVLNDEIEYPINVPFIWLMKYLNGLENKRIPLGLCYISVSNNFKAFVVNILVQDKETGYNDIASVIIPNPKVGGWDELNVFNEITKDSDITIELSHVMNFSIKDDVLDGYNKSWEYFINNR